MSKTRTLINVAMKVLYWLMTFIFLGVVIACIFLELTTNVVKSTLGVPLLFFVGSACIIASCGGMAWSLFKIFENRPTKKQLK